MCERETSRLPPRAYIVLALIVDTLGDTHERTKRAGSGEQCEWPRVGQIDLSPYLWSRSSLSGLARLVSDPRNTGSAARPSHTSRQCERARTERRVALGRATGRSGPRGVGT